MKSPTLAALALLCATLGASCSSTDRRDDGPRAPAATTPGTAARPPAPAAKEDRHFIRDDEVFVIEHEPSFVTAPYFVVLIARVVEPGTPATNGEAKLRLVSDGREIISSHYWKTRPAERTELKKGTTVVFAQYQAGPDGSWGPPPNAEGAHSSTWYHAKVEDDTNLHKGTIRLVEYSETVRDTAVRVIVR